MPVNAVRFIRKLRGGAQAHLLEADDGRFYVTKFVNNPQHRRILVNEFLAAAFLDYLQIASARTAFVRLSPEFLRDNPDVHMQLGHSRTQPLPGWHFGSEFPGHPERTPIFDFLPDALLHKVANLRDFAGILAFDKWVANADARQCVFLRTRLREFAPAYADHPLRVGFVALMIDHGFAFNGPHWEFPDSPIQGLYMRTSVYSRVGALEDFEPWLNRIVHFPEHVVDSAWRRLPPEWVAGEDDELERLLERLLARRARVPGLLLECARCRANPFPSWSAA